MLNYGVQGKCGVCNENSKIIDSHPYSRVVLETVLRGNYPDIFDLQQKQLMQPTNCKWKHLCRECDRATGQEENRFNDSLLSVLESDNPLCETSKEISLSRADLFHVYTFRALLRNVDTHHYIPGCEKNQGCTCSDLFHPLNDFRKRAHHLSRRSIWEGRSEDIKMIIPFEAGMLYHVYQAKIPSHHWIEFPLICKVCFESDQRSHYLVFAQIPPFYWAFPLPLKREDLPDTIPDDMKSSDILVKAHYKEAANDARQLSKDFERIIEEINKELQQKRKSLSGDDCPQKWREQLKKTKEEIDNDSEKLEHRTQELKDKEEGLSIEENDAKWKNSRSHLEEIQKESEGLAKEDKEANRKQEITHKLENLAVERREIIRDNQNLDTKEAEDPEKNVTEEEKLCTEKLNIIKRGLHADLEPKLIIGYFRVKSCCYLEVKVT